MLGSVAGGSPVCMWPVVISLVILPLREVIARPEKELAAQDAAATQEFNTNGVYALLQTHIQEYAARVGYNRPVRLVISQHPFEVRAFGSWRRHYIFLGREVALKVAADLHSPEERPLAEALLYHEIAHLLHKDIQRISYSRALFHSLAVVLSWWGIILILWLAIALLAGRALIEIDINTVPGIDPATRTLLAPLLQISPADRARMAETIQTTNINLVVSFIIYAFWPIICVGFVLWLFFWRQMLRTQEYYADYLAVRAGGEPGALFKAIGRYGKWYRLKGLTQSSGLWSRIRLSWQFWQHTLTDQITRLHPVSLTLWSWQRLFSLHPTLKERVEFVENPAVLFQNWKRIAIPAAALTLAFDVMLITPFFTYYFAGYPIHFSTLALFLLLTTWLLPFIVNQQPTLHLLARSLLIIFGVRWLWLLLNIFLLLSLVFLLPQMALQVMNLIVTSTSGFTGFLDSLPVSDPLSLSVQIIPSLLAHQLLQIVVLVVMLATYVLWQRQAVNQAHVDWSRRHWWGMIAIAVSATTLVLTPFSNWLIGGVGELFTPGLIFSYGLGLLCLGLLLWINFFHSFRTSPPPIPQFDKEDLFRANH